MADDRDQVYGDFSRNVNMAPGELEQWLESEEAQSVGESKDGGGESKGHESGRRIVGILRKNKDDLSESDLERMRRVNAYVARHTAQRPSGEVEDTPWRHSLMNWGHDPLK